jgi:[glutamine synthetase] adenylyltransferase / [glutamine synthetase]-adenylyl-L-tyrosine phosphorylase
MDRRESVRREVEVLDASLDPVALVEYFGRLDEEYLAHFPAERIARHVKLSTQLAPSRPVQLEVRTLGAGEYEIALVAYDYFGELALLCGLLASVGLDIRSGRIHTFEATSEPPLARRRTSGPRHGRRAWPSAATIVDVFIVRPAPEVAFDAAAQASLAAETDALLRLVSEGSLAAARDRLNGRLVERLESLRGRFDSRSYGVDVRFEDAPGARWTVMDVRAQDSPAFLYALANALSLRGIYIQRVEIESLGDEVRDRFFISDRARRPIETEEERVALRTAVNLTKQFTHVLTSAPDPAAAIHAFDQLVDAVVARRSEGRAAASLSEEDLGALAHLLGSSRFLWEDFLRTQVEDLLPLLGHLKSDALPRGRARFAAELDERLAGTREPSGRRLALNEYKDRAMVLIDLKQLLDSSVPLVDFSAAISELAEAVLAGALGICEVQLAERHGRPRLEDGSPCPVALFGLGKFGGRELGYASDVELLCVYGGAGQSDGAESIENGAWCDALARALLETVEARRDGIFEIDLRLRPYGRKGPLASSIEQIESYYSAAGDAAPFERQALVKLRQVAGDEALGRRVEAARDRFVYDGAPWDRATSLHLRARQMRELVEPGAVNVKYGAGGVIDVEYAAQYLQLQHGHLWRELRTPNTLEALAGLKARGILDAGECESLCAAYLFLRRVTDALRMVRGNAKDLVLPAEDSDDYKFLARRLGLKRESWAAAAAVLAEELSRHMSAAHDFYLRRFGDPLAS